MSAPLRNLTSVSKFVFSLNYTRSLHVNVSRFVSIHSSTHRYPAKNQHLNRTQLLTSNNTQICPIPKRWGSGSNFLLRKPGDDLWSSVFGVSRQGRKKGRGKRKGKKVSLNKGQKLGDGRKSFAWPGLNTQLISRKGYSSALNEIQRLPEDTQRERQTRIASLRAESGKKVFIKQAILLRGYAGKKSPGTSIGAPDPIGDYMFEGFDSRVLEVKMVNCMKGTIGRKSTFSSLVAVGNKNGLVGIGKGRASGGKKCIEIAKNRAARSLMYVERFDDHTVFHNMYKEIHRTKLFVHKREKGFGLKCHRVIKSICELAGIKDLHCKVEGSMNVRKAIYCFIAALQEQETHQQLADRTGFYVVEQRKERNYLPVVVAEPTSGKIATKPLIDEKNDLEMDFGRFYYGGKVEYKKPPFQPLYEKYRYKGWVKRQKQHLKFRGQMDIKLLRKAGLINQ